MSDTYTYIERDTLISWGNQMTQLNNEAIDIMDSIDAEVKSLTNYWKGDAADGFTETMNNLIADGKMYHNKMKDIEKMLTEITVTAENQ